MKHKAFQLGKDKPKNVKFYRFIGDITVAQASELGKRIKALQDEREEKRKRVTDLEEVKVVNSDKVTQPVGFIAPEEDIENLIEGL